MIFFIYFTLAWLLTAGILLYKSKLSLQLIAFLYLVPCLIHSNLYILIPDNLKGFTISEKPMHFWSFVLLKTFIVPSFLVLISQFLHSRLITLNRMLFFSVLFALSMALIEITGNKLGLYTFKWWNFYWSFLYYWSLFLFSYLLSTLFAKIEER